MANATEARQLVIRLQPSTLDILQAMAEREKRSMSMQAAWLIERAATQADPGTLEPVAAQPEAAPEPAAAP